MANSTKWKEINSYIQRVRDDCGRKSNSIDNNVSGAFADPESYGKILVSADQGIAGINSAVRKYKNAQDAFEKLFIEKAQSYNVCKRKIQSKSQELTKTHRFAEQIAVKFGFT